MGSASYFIVMVILLGLLLGAFLFLYEPQLERVTCSPESRLVDACIEIYRPVCGWYDPGKVQCVTTPCAITFSNSCFACMDDTVQYWTDGECPA